jgi:hypothetical protein
MRSGREVVNYCAGCSLRLEGTRRVRKRDWGFEAGRIRLRWEEGLTPGLLLGEQEKGPAYGWNIVSFDLDSGDEDEDTDGDGENGKV